MSNAVFQTRVPNGEITKKFIQPIHLLQLGFKLPKILKKLKISQAVYFDLHHCKEGVNCKIYPLANTFDSFGNFGIVVKTFLLLRQCKAEADA